MLGIFFWGGGDNFCLMSRVPSILLSCSKILKEFSQFNLEESKIRHFLMTSCRSAEHTNHSLSLKLSIVVCPLFIRLYAENTPISQNVLVLQYCRESSLNTIKGLTLFKAPKLAEITLPLYESFLTYSKPSHPL